MTQNHYICDLIGVLSAKTELIVRLATVMQPFDTSNDLNTLSYDKRKTKQKDALYKKDKDEGQEAFISTDFLS